MAVDLAELKIVAVDQATATLALIKGKAEELTKSGEGIQKVWNGGLMDGFYDDASRAVKSFFGINTAIADTNKSVKTISSGSSNIDALAVSVQALSENLQKQNGGWRSNVTAISAFVVGIKNGLDIFEKFGGIAPKWTKDFGAAKEKISELSAGVKAFTQNLIGHNDAAVKTVPALQAVQAQTQLAAGGFRSAIPAAVGFTAALAPLLIIGALVVAAVVAIKVAVAGMSDIVSGTVPGFGSARSALEPFADALRDASKAAADFSEKYGYSAVAASTFIGVAERLKISADDGANGMQKLSDAVADNPGKFEALGIAISDSSGKLLPFNQIATNTQTALNEYATASDRAKVANELFGGSTAEVSAAIKLTGPEFEKQQDLLRQYNLLIGTDAIEATKKYTKAQDEFTYHSSLTWRSIKETIGAVVMPMLTDLFEMFTGGWPKVAQAFRNGAVYITEQAYKLRQALLTLADDAIGAWDKLKLRFSAAGDIFAAGRTGDMSAVKATYDKLQTDLSSIDETNRKKAYDREADYQRRLLSLVTSGEGGGAAAAAGTKRWKAQADGIKAVMPLVDELQKKLDALYLKLDAGEDLALVKELELLKLGFEAGKLGLIEMTARIAQAIEGSATYKKAIDEVTKSTAENNAIINANRQAVEDASKAMELGNDTLKNEIAVIGKSALERELYNLELQTTIDLKRIDATLSGDESDFAKQKITDLAAVRAELLKNRAATEENDAVWKSFSSTATDFFSDLFQNGKSAFGNLWKTIKKFFADLAAQFAVKYLLNIGTSGSGGVAGSILSAIMGGGGGGGDGIGGGGEGSMLGAAASVLGVGSFVSGILGTAGLGAAGTAFAASLAATGSATAALTAAGTSLVASGGLLGSAASVLMAIPVWGWIALAVIAAVAYFGGDETGIKIDNNTNGVGNPASHFTKNPLADYDVSGDLPASAFQPLIDAVNKYDQILVDALLSPEQTAAIRARLGSVINPDWIGFDDEASAKTAIGKASKEFLQTRYGAVFDEVDAKIAATVRGFAGGSEELLKYVGEVIAVMQLLKTNAADFAHLIGGTLSIADLSAVQAEGESLLQTLNRVVTVFGATNAVAFLMGKDVTTAFGAVGMASLAARQDLITLAGGISNLSAMTDAYYKNFYSAEERAALELKSKTALITQTFKDLKLDIPESDAEFRKLIESLDLSTESGRATFVALMKINGIFHELHTTVDGVTEAVIAVLAPLTTLYGIMLEAANYSTNMGPGRDSGTRTNGDKNPMRVREDARVVAMALQDALPTALQGYLTGGGGSSTAQNAPTYAIKDRELIDARRNMESALAMSTRLMSEQANGALAAFNRQRNSLQDLMTMSNRSAGALASVVGGMQSMRDATAQLLLQIQQIKAQVGEMFGSTIRDLKLSTMTEQEKYDYYQKDAEEARQLSLKAIDPLEIARLAARVNADVIAAQGLLTPEQRARTNPEQIANLETYNKQVQDWLDVQAKATTKTFDDFMEKLGKKFDAILATEDDISKRNSDSADKQLVAATTPRRFIVDFNANVPGDVETTEVGG